MFSLISNGKYVNGVPYSDPTQFLSALCSLSRDLGVIYYPTKCKGIFSFDFGQSVFIEEFGCLGWMEMSVQCKLIDMTDFSPKAKRPSLPKLNSIADLLVCVDNLINLSIRVFKPEVVDEITCLRANLHRNQNEIKERVQQSPAIVERLADWTNADRFATSNGDGIRCRPIHNRRYLVLWLWPLVGRCGGRALLRVWYLPHWTKIAWGHQLF
jgi:hypothetical protein